MRLALFAVLVVGGLVSCETPANKRADMERLSSSAASVRSPASLRDAVLTLPAEGLAEMSPKGRRDYLGSLPGIFDEGKRRIELYGDNPYEGGDAKSMLYLRLFEDEGGHTIAASHAARPYADGSEPSAAFTRVYRLTAGKWIDITDTALVSVPREAYFRFDKEGDQVAYGLYQRQSHPAGRIECWPFGPELGHVIWKNGSFQIHKKTDNEPPPNRGRSMSHQRSADARLSPASTLSPPSHRNPGLRYFVSYSGISSPPSLSSSSLSALRS